MNFIKNKLLLVAIGLIFLPTIGHAQGGLPITPEDMQRMIDMEKALNEQFSLINDPVKAATDLQAQAQAAEDFCNELGGRLTLSSSNSGTKRTAKWSGSPHFDCHGAIYVGDVKHLSDEVDALLIGVTANGTTIDRTFLANIDAKERASSGQPEWWERILNFIVVTLTNILASLLAGLATIALALLNLVVSNTTYAIAPEIVAKTWTVVRDFMNLMFILAIIAMAIATIIRYEAYNYKRILRDLVIMAVLINFSMVIANAMIAVSDMLIRFLQPEAGILEFGKTIFSAFVTDGTAANFFGQDVKFANGFGSSITKIVALVVLLVSVTAIALMMFVRLIGLWFLVMLSPAAFALNVLPATKKYAHRWWENFIKYLIWGPVCMFFFRVAFVLIDESAKGNIIRDQEWLSHLFVAAFLWGGFLVAKSAGMQGAGAITSGADAALKRAQRYGKNTAKGVGVGAWATSKWIGSGKGMTAFGRLANNEGMQNIGKKWESGTAKLQAYPAARVQGVKDKYFVQPTKDRQKLIEAEKRRTQILYNYLGDFDKDSAAKISNVDVVNLAMNKIEGKAGLNLSKVENIIEHGKKDAKKSSFVCV